VRAKLANEYRLVFPEAPKGSPSRDGSAKLLLQPADGERGHPCAFLRRDRVMCAFLVITHGAPAGAERDGRSQFLSVAEGGATASP